jgi:hypothetical protein
MNTLKKITLASAIAAAPFMAQAELTPMDDALMGDTTGQAGVTVEIELGASGITIDSVTYTDTKGAADTDGGSVVLENISITGLGKLTQTIDVDGAGDLKMTTTAPTADVLIALGNDAADVTGTKSGLKLQAVDGSDSEIINNLNMTVALGSSTTTIKNLGNAASAGLGPLSGAGVADTATTAYSGKTSSMAIQMSSSLEIKDLDLGVFGYTNAQANVIGDSKAAAYATAYAATAPASQAAFAAANGDADNSGAIDGAELTGLKNSIATGSAIQVTDVTVTGIGGGAMSMDQTIWAVGGDASQPGSEAGVYIQMGAMNADINVGGIAIGGSSIGSVAVSGLRMAGMTQRIYGH